MAGDELSAKDKLDLKFQQLDAYLTKKGLPKPEARSIDQYVNMERTELSKYDSETLGEIAAEIDNYAYYLQDLINQHEVKRIICDQEIKGLVGHRLDQYKVYGQEEKWLAAIYDNDHARAFLEIKKKHDQIIARLQFLTKRLEKLSSTLETLQMTKRKYYGSKN